MSAEDLQKGSRAEIDIVDMSDEGKGIGRYDGLVIFVAGCVPGDRVLCEITKKKKRYAIAKLVEITTFSPHRTDVHKNKAQGESGRENEEFSGIAGIDEANVAGGCIYHNINYDAELEIKENQVKSKLMRIGKAKEDVFEDITGMQQPSGYRNKAVFAVSTGGNIMRKGGIIKNLGAPRVGFRKQRSHEVIDCRKCEIQSPVAMAAADALRRFMSEDNITAWDEKWQQGLMRHLVVRTAFATGEVMIVLVINGKGIPNQNKLIEMMDEAVYDAGYSLESVYYNINKEKTSEIFGDEMIHIAGKQTITDELKGLRFEVSPRSFYQVNPVMCEALYDKVREYLTLDLGEPAESNNDGQTPVAVINEKKPVVLDLYCGVGSIGLQCADMCEHVVGIEVVEDAIRDANRNAVINGIVNARYVLGKAEEILPAVLSGELHDIEELKRETRNLLDEDVCKQIRTADAVILDPPRKGCHPALLDSVMSLAPERIVYVSCDAATLARDVAYMAGKYELQLAAPFDMFPRTGSVECVCLLGRVQ